MAADNVVIFAAQLAAHPFQRLAHGALVLRTLEVQSGLVAEGRVCRILKPDRFQCALYSRHNNLSKSEACTRGNGERLANEMQDSPQSSPRSLILAPQGKTGGALARMFSQIGPMGEINADSLALLYFFED